MVKQGDSIERSYQLCRKIAKQSGSNFYQGMWFTLNRNKRFALFAVYAWMRAIDDIADGDLEHNQKLNQIHIFFQQTENLYTDPVNLDNNSFWLALQDTIRHYPIPLSYFREMYLGQIQSIEQDVYVTFSDLYQYCYRVASIVGLICVSIWGYKGGDTALKLAEYRGIALQLTNIIRDVYKDRKEGKLFIPTEWVEKNEKLDSALQKMILQAEYYYQASSKLDRMVSRRGSLSLQLMTNSYIILLSKIKKTPNQVLEGQMIKLTRSEKLTLCITGIFKWCLAT